MRTNVRPNEVIHDQRATVLERDLARIATDLSRRKTQRTWREASYAMLEKQVMLGFYVARKLIEAAWVDPRITTAPVTVTAFPCRNSRTYRGAWQDVQEQYDLTKPARRKLQLKFLCDQIIHSFVFTPAFRRKRLTALYFCSYKERNHVFRANIDELVRILQETSRSRHLILARFGVEVNRLDEPYGGRTN